MIPFDGRLGCGWYLIQVCGMIVKNLFIEKFCIIKELRDLQMQTDLRDNYWEWGVNSRNFEINEWYKQCKR